MPTATGVAIVDDDGSDALQGDSLTGLYTFADADGDAEGATAFRWLRDGLPIPGAVASTHTLVAADVPARIEFEVTPAALTGKSPGVAVRSAELATGTAPVVTGQARYHDVNANGAVDAGDTLVVPFDQPVGVGTASATGIVLPVPGDVLAVTSIAAGPGANEVTLTLDDAAQLKARQIHPVGQVLAQNDPSGVDVAPGMAADAVESLSGKDAAASSAIDVIPAYVTGPNAFAAGGSKWVEAGDFDRDGHLDAVVVAPGGNEIRAWLQANDGSFDATIFQIGFEQEPISFVNRLALGDLDGDGDLDVVTARLASNRVWLNRIGEEGFFGDFELTDELGSAATESVALGDIDGDGDLDVVAANDGGNRVWKNNGVGGFTDTGQSLGGAYSIAVALADVDRDGDLDAVFANATAGDTVWLNGGTGFFTDSGQSIGTTSTWAVALGDLDRDGHLDLALAKTGGGNEVWFNDGGGDFDYAGLSYGSGVSRDVAIADYDGDGDLDGDGDDDLVVANLSGPDRVWLWIGTAFVDSGQALGNDASRSVALGDLDRDGDLDLVAATAVFDVSAGINRVWLNNGAGVFSSSGQSLGSNNSMSVALGDVDNDGDLDMAVGNWGGSTAWLNNGSGGFSDTGQSLGTDLTRSVALGRLDLDNNIDLVAGNLGPADIVYENPLGDGDLVIGVRNGANKVYRNE